MRRLPLSSTFLYVLVRPGSCTIPSRKHKEWTVVHCKVSQRAHLNLVYFKWCIQHSALDHIRLHVSAEHPWDLWRAKRQKLLQDELSDYQSNYRCLRHLFDNWHVRILHVRERSWLAQNPEYFGRGLQRQCGHYNRPDHIVLFNHDFLPFGPTTLQRYD